MKKYKSIIIIITVFFMPLFITKAMDYYGHPNGVNYATNTETTDYFNLKFCYDGYVQITPSYNYEGSHAIRGRFSYVLPNNQTHQFYTEMAANTSVSGVLSRSATVYDDYFNWSTKTKFYYQFTWVPPGTSVSRSVSY